VSSPFSSSASSPTATGVDGIVGPLTIIVVVLLALRRLVGSILEEEIVFTFLPVLTEEELEVLTIGEGGVIL
jgi:hypothetical protein